MLRNIRSFYSGTSALEPIFLSSADAFSAFSLIFGISEASAQHYTSSLAFDLAILIAAFCASFAYFKFYKTEAPRARRLTLLSSMLLSLLLMGAIV